MNYFEKKITLAISYIKQWLIHMKYTGCKFGKKVYIKRGFRVQVDDKGILEIDDRTFFDFFCSIAVQNRILIGSDCLFGESVKIYDHNHVFKYMPMPIAEQGFSRGGGGNCWK